MKTSFAVVVALFALSPVVAQPPAKWWPKEVDATLDKAGANKAELEKALNGAEKDHRPGLAFLLTHMPEKDAKALKADYLLENLSLAYKARAEFAWAKAVPEATFFNNVLPYCNIDETRDPWRKELYALCKPMVKDCKTATDVAMTLNKELFPKLKVKYSTARKAANQGPLETMKTGLASCTGLSILLSDACRAVGVPTRVVGVQLWADKRGNHTWLEIWDKDWHFTGACEPDPSGLDRGWFVGDAAKAKKDEREHAVFAASFAKQSTHFPLVWALKNTDVPGENVTDRYAKAAPKAETAKLLVRVVGADGKRVAVAVKVEEKGKDTAAVSGTSRGETNDTNDILAFDLKSATEYVVTVGETKKAVTTPAAGKQETMEIRLPK